MAPLQLNLSAPVLSSYLLDTTLASVGFSARLVEVATGQVLWTGTIESDGPSLREATSKACERFVKALKAAWPSKRGA